MVSFSCEICADIVVKKKLDAHRSYCRGASFSCLDCGQHFQGVSYRQHTSCISEAQKSQKSMYREKKKGNNNGRTNPTTTATSTAMIPRKAYFEEVPDADSGAIAVVDAPPRAPSPPPPRFNVFDYLDADQPRIKQNKDASILPTPDDSNLRESGAREDEQDTWYDIEELPADAMQYEQHHPQSMDMRIEYGNGPVAPSYERYDSNPRLPLYSNHAHVTPHRREVSARGHGHAISNDSTGKKSGKRKRGHPDHIDVAASTAPQPQIASNGDVIMTDGPPAMHSGLTGGLNKLMSARNANGFPFPPSPDFSGEGEGAGASPLSPIKRPKHVVIEVRRPEKERGREPKARPVLKRKAPGSHVRLGFSSQTKRDRDAQSLLHDRDRDTSAEHRRRRRRHRSNSPADDYERHQSSRRQLNTIEYHHLASAGPNDSNALVRRDPGTVAVKTTALTSMARAELFMSFVKKGPDSERGCSINKALKRYHRERKLGMDDYDYDDDDRDREGRKRRREEREREREKRAEEKADEEKELWKSLRLRRNDHGEIVLFFGE